MKIYLNNDLISKTLKLLIFLLMFAISGMGILNGNNTIHILLLGIILVLSFIVFKPTKKINLLYLLLYFCLIAFIVINSFFNFNSISIKSLIYTGFLITAAFLLSFCFSIKEFAQLFVKAMRFLIVSSIVIFAICSIFKIYRFFPIIENGYSVKYYSIIIWNCDSYVSIINLRNSSLFSEPGVFAAFIALCFICDLSLEKKIDTRWFVVYCLALITTKSTAGFAYLILMILINISRFNLFKKNKMLLYSLFVIGVILFLLFYNIIINRLAIIFPKMFLKIVDQNTSFTDRFYSPVIDMYLLFNNPIGYGEGAIGQILKQGFVIFDTKMSLSVHVSTLTYYAPIYGLGFFICYCTLFYNLLKNIKINITIKILCILLLLSILISNPMQNYLLLWVSLFLPGIDHNLKRVPHSTEIRGEKNEYWNNYNLVR